MNTRNVFHAAHTGTGDILNVGSITIRGGQKRRLPTIYPTGCIGSDLRQRNYIRYLVERYNRFKQADTSFGQAQRRFSFAVIFKHIEAEFRAPTYFIPRARFEELVDYLQARIDGTILGKRNTARGQGNYESFDEYQSAHSGVEMALNA